MFGCSTPQDLPRPDFMSKEATEMTEEEIRMAREFEKKEAAFLEEREKLKRVWTRPVQHVYMVQS